MNFIAKLLLGITIGLIACDIADAEPQRVYLCHSEQYANIYGRAERPCKTSLKTLQLMWDSMLDGYERLFHSPAKAKRETARAFQAYVCGWYTVDFACSDLSCQGSSSSANGGELP